MTKKQIPLSPEQFQQLMIATANLPFLHLKGHEADYINQVLETPINFQMRVEVVIKALNHFRQNVQVQHGIHTFHELKQALARFPDTELGNKECANWLFGNNHWTRVELLRRFMAFLDRNKLTDLNTLTVWAQQVNFERDFKDQVKGMGLAVFNWLLLRLGVQIIKPDVWVLNFGERVLGKPIQDERLLNALMEIAPLIGESPIDIDRTLWHHERMNLAIDDVPALRVVWWHLFQQELQQRLNQASSDDSSGDREWQVVLDDKETLRYQQAGVSLMPQMFQVSCEPIQATEIRVQQSQWHLGFDLWLEVKFDKALNAESIAVVSAALDKHGWELEMQPQFVASLDLDIDLIIPPDTLFDDLNDWSVDVAKDVVVAIQQLIAALHQCLPMTIKGDNYKSLPKFLLVKGVEPPTRPSACHDGNVKAIEESNAEMKTDGVMSADEFLDWLAHELENGLDLTLVKA
jgi:hypothetical protein